MNSKLADVCDQLSQQFQEDHYRCRAYKNAAMALRNHPREVTSGKQAEIEIRGIGKSIATKIDEFLATGSLTLLNQIKEETKEEETEKDTVMKLFKGIYGVGDKISEKWYERGYRTLEDILKIYHQLTDAQKLGYQYYYHLQERIPRAEMDIIKEVLHNTMTKVGAEYEICGSYRRGEKDSGDVDCLVKGDQDITISKILSELMTTGFIVGDLAVGPSKYMGILQFPGRIARRLDILIVEPKAWPYATLYFTGSKQLNIVMRAKAIAMNLRLNEYGMVNSEGVDYLATSEEQIFEYLQMGYLEPHQRSIGSK